MAYSATQITTTLQSVNENRSLTDILPGLLSRLGKSRPDSGSLSYATILRVCGLDAALRCLLAEPRHSSVWVALAIVYARRASALFTDWRGHDALDTASRYIRGEATAAELDTIRALTYHAAPGSAAGRAANLAAHDAADTVPNVAHVASAVRIALAGDVFWNCVGADARAYAAERRVQTEVFLDVVGRDNLRRRWVPANQ